MITPENIRILYKDKKNSSGRIKGNELVLYISSRLSPELAREHIRILTDKLLRQAVSRPEPVRPAGLTPSGVTDDEGLQRWAVELNRCHYGFALNRVRFKRQKRRWGSCSLVTRNIYISERLRGGPHELLEYVLVHEICHLKGLFPPHGPAFWRLVAGVLPDYRERRRQLRQYGFWLDAREL